MGVHYDETSKTGIIVKKKHTFDAIIASYSIYCFYSLLPFFSNVGGFLLANSLHSEAHALSYRAFKGAS